MQLTVPYPAKPLNFRPSRPAQLCSLYGEGQVVGHTRPFSCIDCLAPACLMVFPFLKYLFSKGNMQPGLNIFLQIRPAQIGLFWELRGLSHQCSSSFLS